MALRQCRTQARPAAFLVVIQNWGHSFFVGEPNRQRRRIDFLVRLFLQFREE
jgi:hypothetical protein